MTSFRDLFGKEPAVQSEAPGRVNLIGEHTDYNGGLVLPAAIPQRTRVQLTPRLDRHVRAASANAPGGVVEYELGSEAPGRGWLDFVQGATAQLGEQGQRPGGFDLFVRSDVPVGSGLSSSAALGIGLLRALREAFSLPLDDVALARLWQRVENRFVGAQVGIMDPMACALCRPGTALFLDARTLDYEVVPLPPEIDWVVINSGVAHQHSAGDYNARRAECERACAFLGVPDLRSLDASNLSRALALPEPLSRRCRHVVTENARVLAAVAALRSHDCMALGQLMSASHDSQRDDYAVSVPAIDQLVACAREQPEAQGARLTGGGFGGSVVLFTEAGKARQTSARIARLYAQRTGNRPTVLVPEGVA